MILPADSAPPSPPSEAAPKQKRRKSKGPSPTARSLKHLRDLGYRAEVVEKRLPRCFITRDLFGFIDILAIRKGEVLGVQACSSGGSSGRGSDVATRIRKIAECETVHDVRDAGIRIVVHGWRRNAAGEWTLDERDIS